jgi:hypothetical protein
MADLFAQFSNFAQKLAAGAVLQPSALMIPPARCTPEGGTGAPILKDKCYITLTVNELFLSKARKWFAEYQPMVVFTTSFIQGDTTVTVPSMVGPSLLARPGLDVPQGLIINDIEVAGPTPYRGGTLTISATLYRVKHSDYASALLQVVEGVSKAIGPTANLAMLTKVGGPLLDGMKSLLGLGDTEGVMAQRFTLSPVGPGGMRSFYAALIGPESATAPDDLSVDCGRLRVRSGAGAAPFTGADYILYSLTTSARRTDESTLPFYPLFERARKDAYQGGDENWKTAKATFSEAWQQMRASPDLTLDQALELREAWQAELLAEKRRGESDKLLSIGEPARAADERTKIAASILDL